MGKKFLIIGNMNAITYKEVFPYIKNNELWLGCVANKTMEFQLGENYEKWDRIDENSHKYGKVPAITWFTNIPHAPAGKPLVLEKRYSPENYPKYDNYDAIEVSRVADIPVDYDGVMGVPITFLDKWCPDQFEIVDAREVALHDKQKNKQTYLIKDADGSINGKNTYSRICIRRKDALEPADFEIVGLMSGAKDTTLINGNDGRVKFYLNNKGVYSRILIRRNAENISQIPYKCK